MCRLYTKNGRVYTRCCSRTPHRGLRLDGDHRGPAGHVRFGQPRTRRPAFELKPTRGWRKCPECGGPALKWGEALCWVCRKENPADRQARRERA